MEYPLRFHSHPIFFQCLRCGKCCKDFIMKTKHGKAGIFLLPEERKLFPPEKVYPLFGIGIGDSKGSKPQTVIAYQYADSQCIHLGEDNLCSIYNRRPQACRGFPYEFTLQGIYLNRCSFLNQFTSDQIKQIQIPNSIVKANIKINKHLIGNLKRSLIHWFFDVEEKKWKRI